jgi:hypothetical protein
MLLGGILSGCLFQTTSACSDIVLGGAAGLTVSIANRFIRNTVTEAFHVPSFGT